MIATLLLLTIHVMSLGYSIAKHGEKKAEKHQYFNAWNNFIAMLIVFSLYYWAGLFNVFLN